MFYVLSLLGLIVPEITFPLIAYLFFLYQKDRLTGRVRIFIMTTFIVMAFLIVTPLFAQQIVDFGQISADTRGAVVYAIMLCSGATKAALVDLVLVFLIFGHINNQKMLGVVQGQEKI